MKIITPKTKNEVKNEKFKYFQNKWKFSFFLFNTYIHAYTKKLQKIIIIYTRSHNSTHLHLITFIKKSS